MKTTLVRVGIPGATLTAALCLLSLPCAAQPEPGSFRDGGIRPQPPMGGMFLPGTPSSPEIAKKTRTLLALREFVVARLTAEDIQTVLTALKGLRIEEQKLQEAVEASLDAQIKATLAARTPDDLNNAIRTGDLRSQNEAFRVKQQATWETITAAIGEDKALRLRRLSATGMVPPPFRDGRPPRDGFNGDRPPRPGGNIRRGPSPDGQPPPGDAPPPFPPGGGFGQGGPSGFGSGFGGGMGGLRLPLPELIELLEMRLAAMK